jgi:hypothetical protein
MSDDKLDNLKDLLETFMDPKQARQAAEEIRKGEQILRQNPAPEPKLELILKIKAQGISQLRRRRHVRIWRKYAMEAVAAVAVLGIVASVGLRLFQNGRSSIAYIPRAIWETYDITNEDPKLAYCNTEIEQLEQQFHKLQSPDEETRTTYDEVSEMEMEILEIETEFWKG